MPTVIPQRKLANTPVDRSLKARKHRQVMASLSHYVYEISRSRSPRDVLDWTYYKFPNNFQLRDFPPVLNLEITNECNFACPHCPRDALNKNRHLGFMPMALFDRIMDEAVGRVSLVKLIGLGESSLHPDLDLMMRSLRDKRIKGLLHTNGTLFERFTPKQIFEWRLDEIVVSIDGTDERSFARLRPGGDLKILKTKLTEFHQQRAQTRGPTPRIEVRHVIMPNETPEMLKAFTEYWRGSVADTVKYCFLGTPYDKPRLAEPNRPPCRDIRREMHIRFDGRVPLCGYSGHGEWIGELTVDRVSEVWRSGRLSDVRERHERRDLETLPFCKTCQFC